MQNGEDANNATNPTEAPQSPQPNRCTRALARHQQRSRAFSTQILESGSNTRRLEHTPDTGTPQHTTHDTTRQGQGQGRPTSRHNGTVGHTRDTISHPVRQGRPSIPSSSCEPPSQVTLHVDSHDDVRLDVSRVQGSFWVDHRAVGSYGHAGLAV